jgi:hypothetical protein
MLTAREKANAHIWRAAHDFAARNWPHIKSGMCLQVGLAEAVAHHVVDAVDAERGRLCDALKAAAPYVHAFAENAPHDDGGAEAKADLETITAALAAACPK